MDKIRVTLVDDHQIVRDGIKNILEDQDHICIVDEFSNGQEFLNSYKADNTDLILLDINMPVRDGIETTKKAFSSHKGIKIIALSMYDEEEYIVRILDAGAKGYILKNCSSQELIKAIETVNSGSNYFSPEVSDKLLNSFTKEGKNNLNYPNEKNDLTTREKEILKLIAEEFTNQEIANKLFISNRTVDTHRRNLLQKLEAKNTAGLVKHAFRLGLTK